MPVKPYFFGKVDHGRLVHANPEAWFGYLRQFEQQDVRLIVERRPKGRGVRSTEQNSYYWGVCLSMLSEHTGYEANEMHELCKIMFNGKEIEGQVIGQSTTKLDTGQMTDFIENIRKWAATKLGLHIPDPNQVTT